MLKNLVTPELKSPVCFCPDGVKVEPNTSATATTRFLLYLPEFPVSVWPGVLYSVRPQPEGTSRVESGDYDPEAAAFDRGAETAGNRAAEAQAGSPQCPQVCSFRRHRSITTHCQPLVITSHFQSECMGTQIR